MAPLKWRKKLLLAKIESAAGTAVHLGGDNAILAKNIEISPLAGDTVDRDLERSHLGNSGQIHVNSHQTLAFGVELATSGVLGMPPAWGPLLQGCAMSEVVIDDDPKGSGRVNYAPVDRGEKTLTFGLNIDGQLHTLTGARGSFSLEINANQIPELRFAFLGKYQPPTSRASIAANYSKFKLPQVASSANTLRFELLGVPGMGLSALSYEHGNTTIHRELIGRDSEVIITDRRPTCSVTIDAPAVSAMNLVELATSGATGRFVVEHGAGAGNICRLRAPTSMLSAPSYSESDGVWQVQLSVLPQPTPTQSNIDVFLDIF